MATVTIDYEGEVIERDLSVGATHVVISQRPDGHLRVQGTRDPMNAVFEAKDAGDDGARMAPIEDGHATFAEVPLGTGTSPAVGGIDLSVFVRAGAVVLFVLLVAAFAVLV